MRLIKQQKGQGLAELTIVGTLVLIPIFLSLPLLTKFIEARHKNLQATRYAAWERTIWLDQAPMDATQTISKASSEIESELESRIFSKAETPIRSDSHSVTGISQDWMLIVKSPWESQPKSLLKPPQNRRFPNKMALGKTTASHRLSRMIRKGLRPLHATGFSPNTNGLIKAGVETSIRPISWNPAFDPKTNGHKQYSMQSELYLLTDGWTAESPDQVGESVAKLLPAQQLAELLDLSEQAKDVSTSVGAALPWLKPLESFELGKVETEIVPDQRLMNLP